VIWIIRNSEDLYEYHNPATRELEEIPKENVTFWPSPSKRDQPSWSFNLFYVDHDIKYLFDDIYVALNNDLRVLAAIGIRTVFDRASELLGIASNLSFSNKLDQLTIIGKIGEDDKKTLSILTDAGSAAAHRSWRPKPEELNTMMDIIEEFLRRTFILKDAVENLRTSFPARERVKKAIQQSTEHFAGGHEVDGMEVPGSR
jgi:hypothetical protein